MHSDTSRRHEAHEASKVVDGDGDNPLSLQGGNGVLDKIKELLPANKAINDQETRRHT